MLCFLGGFWSALCQREYYLCVWSEGLRWKARGEVWIVEIKNIITEIFSKTNKQKATKLLKKLWALSDLITESSSSLVQETVSEENTPCGLPPRVLRLSLTILVCPTQEMVLAQVSLRKSSMRLSLLAVKLLLILTPSNSVTESSRPLLMLSEKLMLLSTTLVSLETSLSWRWLISTGTSSWRFTSMVLTKSPVQLGISWGKEIIKMFA